MGLVDELHSHLVSIAMVIGMVKYLGTSWKAYPTAATPTKARM